MKYFLLILALISLFSCWKSESNNSKKETWVIQETTQILNDYPTTLENSIKDAKDVKKIYDNKANELNNTLENLKK